MLAICHNPLSWMCRLPVPASRSMPKATQASGFQFDIAPGQTPQNVADQLLNEIQNRLGGAAQETVDVRIETGEGGELSLVLQSSAGPITAGINFESSIQGQSGTQQINTVELPDQLDPGETLELTLTVNTPTGTPQTVTLSQDTILNVENISRRCRGDYWLIKITAHFWRWRGSCRRWFRSGHCGFLHLDLWSGSEIYRWAQLTNGCRGPRFVDNGRACVNPEGVVSSCDFSDVLIGSWPLKFLQVQFW